MTLVVCSVSQRWSIIRLYQKLFWHCVSCATGTDGQRMILKLEQYLCVLCLTGLTTSVSGIQADSTSLLDETSKSHRSCSIEQHRFFPAGTVAFVHGDVTDQQGKQIENGSNLSAEDMVSVDSNGFLSVLLSDNNTVNMQPNSVTSIACTITKQSGSLVVTQPHLIGATRG